jgi:hypothetical protein
MVSEQTKAQARRNNRIVNGFISYEGINESVPGQRECD